MLQHLFTYGTLAPGRKNHHLLEAVPGQWQTAEIRGRLVNAGWGYQSGFPALIPDTQGQLIEGYLFSSTELERCWPTLDRFEGEDYVRIVIPVETGSGASLDAFVYALNPTLAAQCAGT